MQNKKSCSICDGQIFLIHQFRDIFFFRCLSCGTIHRKSEIISQIEISELSYWAEQKENSQSHSSNNTTIYEEQYFNADYEKQYGRSYQSDEPAIRNLAKMRLNRIEHLLGEKAWQQRSELSFCDIGCALGFFLDEARQSGFDHLFGIEISQYAADFCQQQFNIPVLRQSLNDWQPARKFDIITMFYVLEHFANQKEIFKKVTRALAPGGLLILALPSTWGPHYTWQKKSWFSAHPEDHFVDYDPLSIRIVLKRFGFSVKQVYPGSAHYERYPGFFSYLANMNFFTTMENIRYSFEFGDTMEVYAKRINY